MTASLPSAKVVPGHLPDSIEDAVDRLRSGRLVGLPTETVYGLAAPTFDPVGIERIYECKGRPADNPLIAHAADVEMARTLVTTWPEEATRLADALWPGPLTLVLPKRDDVPGVATGGRDSIGVRVPAHRVAIEVIGRLGAPVSAPSANRSGSLSPTEARHVKADFVDKDVLILDGGPCRVGLESTVLDLRPVLDGGRPRMLRPGAVTAARPTSRPSSTRTASFARLTVGHTWPGTRRSRAPRSGRSPSVRKTVCSSLWPRQRAPGISRAVAIMSGAAASIAFDPASQVKRSSPGRLATRVSTVAANSAGRSGFWAVERRSW